jgi:frataxin-like iron-binding protein CyaY
LAEKTAEPDTPANSRLAGQLTVYGNSNIIIADHIPLRRLWLSFSFGTL